MERLEEYQDLGDDFWNTDYSSVYDSQNEESSYDYNSDFYFNTNKVKFKDRTNKYQNPFTLIEINNIRAELFTKFSSEKIQIHIPIGLFSDFKFGKHKGHYVEAIFINNIKYIEWLIVNTGAVFRLKNYYTLAIKYGLPIPILLINEIKFEYKLTPRSKIFDGDRVKKIADKNYELFL